VQAVHAGDVLVKDEGRRQAPSPDPNFLSPADGSTLRGAERRGCCGDCGAALYVEAGALFDVAVHDCRTGEWTLLAFRLPDERDRA
jgi:hypothetical protein